MPFREDRLREKRESAERDKPGGLCVVTWMRGLSRGRRKKNERIGVENEREDIEQRPIRLNYRGVFQALFYEKLKVGRSEPKKTAATHVKLKKRSGGKGGKTRAIAPVVRGG